MTGKHWVAFGVGVAVGFFILPMVMNIFRSKASG